MSAYATRRSAPAARACLALALCALLLPRTGEAQAILRAPGMPPFSDGKLIVGGLGINGNATFLTQFKPAFETYLNRVLGATLNKTFVAVRGGGRCSRCALGHARAARAQLRAQQRGWAGLGRRAVPLEGFVRGAAGTPAPPSCLMTLRVRRPAPARRCISTSPPRTPPWS
jgi:hypothetical protein